MMETRNRVCLGSCGSGKTYHLQRMCAESERRGEGWAKIVLDINAEFPGAPAGGLEPPIGVRTAAGAQKALEAGATYVVVRPSVHAGDPDAVCPWGPIADDLAEVAITSRQGVILVLPEAHTVARQGRTVPRNVATILHRFRHTGSGLWCDTQHPARLDKEILDAAHVLYQFRTGSPRDVERLREQFGRTFGDAVVTLSRYVSQLGEPGWHIRIPVEDWPEPPYEAVRIELDGRTRTHRLGAQAAA